ncbi:bifunctional protein-serine/threonine kinase/phosphatase [Hahella ganghwensis]|uniref:bifunctional protein-serine/threonine kinase/phosphatase n=1 Tax=Hahella ganghwensis TaxID=286420 RepID=UPI000376CEBD|nr:bifunctional protein-serine/threonine kinase/phosphatase [Hahella ganghwensis]
MALQLDIGQLTTAGIKPLNEDAVGHTSLDSELYTASKGAVFLLADGVSSCEAGQEASRQAVMEFQRDYLITPDTWSVEHAGRKALTSLNLRLYKRSHEFTQQEKGYLCTFTGLILKSRTAHFFHLGDSRLYRLREGELQQLTKDHVATLGGGRRMLARALGMDSVIQIDYGQSPVIENDIFLLTSDGIHDFLNAEQLTSLLILARNDELSAHDLADLMVDRALRAGSDDNISVILVRVLSLPDSTLEDYSGELNRLPFPPDLEPGMVLDGYEVIRELFASSRSQLYLVKDQSSGDQLVMKTPSRNFEEDMNYIDRFIQEEWIGKRISSPHVVRVVTQTTKRTALYYLMEYVEGESLDTWMDHHRFPKPKLAIQLVKQIAQGLRALHEHDTVHQDLKPANIMVMPSGNIKLVDFGSVYVAGVAEVFRPLEQEGALGTACYSDPQYLLGHNSGRRGDLYSLATITYEIFTGELPYGEQINECRSAFDYDRLRYRSASQFNPVIPLWFDRALEKGVAIDPEQRYLTIDQFLKDLLHLNPDFLRNDPRLGDDRSPVLFWQILSGFWVLILLLVITLFSCQGGAA